MKVFSWRIVLIVGENIRRGSGGGGGGVPDGYIIKNIVKQTARATSTQSYEDLKSTRLKFVCFI